jgi:hypothetical protein
MTPAHSIFHLSRMKREQWLDTEQIQERQAQGHADALRFAGPCLQPHSMEGLSCPSCVLDASVVKDGDVEKVMDAFSRREELRGKVGEGFLKMKEKSKMGKEILAKKLNDWGFTPFPEKIRNWPELIPGRSRPSARALSSRSCLRGCPNPRPRWSSGGFLPSSGHPGI